MHPASPFCAQPFCAQPWSCEQKIYQGKYGAPTGCSLNEGFVRALICHHSKIHHTHLQQKCIQVAAPSTKD